MSQRTAHTDESRQPVDRDLRDMERIAVELARLAGTQIQAAFGGMLAVKYKDAPEAQMNWRDPVSEVDHRIEVLMRTRLAERFPDHDILGEEMVDRPGRDHHVVWAVDPIDGTTNFVNGFPLFASSIGVLHHGQPVVGALWCATSHALRPGVYHARRGAPLHFDEEAIDPKPNPAVRRRIAGVPHSPRGGGLPWDTRKTGSAALECAFVAAGLLRVAWFERPNIWDIAGGIALALAGGSEVRMRGPSGWEPLHLFEPIADPQGGPADLRHWRRAMIVGDSEAVAQLCRIEAA